MNFKIYGGRWDEEKHRLESLRVIALTELAREGRCNCYDQARLHADHKVVNEYEKIY